MVWIQVVRTPFIPPMAGHFKFLGHQIRNIYCRIRVNILYGELGEGGFIRGIIDLFGIPCVYSRPQASAISLDKWRTKLLAKACDIDTSPSYLIEMHNIEKTQWEIESQFEFPLICKPNNQGSSVGVYLARDSQELRKFAENICARYHSCLIEPFLSGREYSVGVIEFQKGPCVLPIMEITYTNKPYLDIETKWSLVTRKLSCPAEVDVKKTHLLSHNALTMHKSIGCYPASRIDFREDASGCPLLLEINHHPGMTASSWLPIMAKVAGIPFELLVLELLAAAWGDRKSPLLPMPTNTDILPTPVVDTNTIILLTTPKTSPLYSVSDEAKRFITKALNMESLTCVEYQAFVENYCLNHGGEHRVLEIVYSLEGDQIVACSLGCIRH